MPVESESDTVECFVGHQVPGRGGRVEDFKKVAAERDRWDDEEESSAIPAKGLGISETVIVDGNEVVAEGGAW